MDDAKNKSEVWEFIQDMNRAWTVENKPEKLREYFHRDMVAITPTGAKRIDGGDACVRGWSDFTKAAKTTYWKEIDPKISLFGDGKFAIVTYYFDMEFVMGGQSIRMNGRDMFALVKENDRWWVVADQYSRAP